MTTLFDFYRQTRDLIGKKPLPPHPFFLSYQLLAALQAIAGSKKLIPIQESSGRAPLCINVLSPQEAIGSVAKSCQLACLWARLAAHLSDSELAKAAENLAGFLSPIVAERLTTLWTSDKEYQVDETLTSIQLFLQATGQEVAMAENDLFPFLPPASILPAKDCLIDPTIHYELSRGENAAIAITGAGHQTSAGAARVGDLEIVAFGPHLAPLNNPEGFGVGPGQDGWFCAHAAKDIWLKAVGKAEASKINISLDSVGVTADKPLAFVFYVRADGCLVDQKVMKPQSLTRFAGEAKEVQFVSRGGKVLFSTDAERKIEIIPLAGDKTFWGATFLLAVWLSPVQRTTSFQFEMPLPHS